MQPSELAGIIAFLRAAESLKTAARSGWTSAGRQESVAEHTWRLCLMALVFHSAFPDVDLARLIRICIVHDLGEALDGAGRGVDRVVLGRVVDPGEVVVMS